jgi:hypothetical protein
MMAIPLLGCSYGQHDALQMTPIFEDNISSSGTMHHQWYRSLSADDQEHISVLGV